MLIKFTGYMHVPDPPDDAGSIDNWLARFIKQAVTDSLETDDLFDALQMSWIVDKEKGQR